MSQNKMTRSRCFTFTMNNYPDTSMVDSMECKFMIYGKEGKEPDKTDHLQGFMVAPNLGGIQDNGAMR